MCMQLSQSAIPMSTCTIAQEEAAVLARLVALDAEEQASQEEEGGVAHEEPVDEDGDPLALENDFRWHFRYVVALLPTCTPLMLYSIRMGCWVSSSAAGPVRQTMVHLHRMARLHAEHEQLRRELMVVQSRLSRAAAQRH